eukprot:TRINITY_DN5728_c0_g1_i1.p1 TRINITY_DN5728_c0_g1~~TRINITY_DN5728_c0_g1_i1.p1  ORF type:complete len:145 (-),score=23.71 TRINITY_DN5728_c0_g1_i1:130-564(-)
MVDVSDPTIADAVKAVLSDANDTNWLVLGYEGNTIKVVGSGAGGLEELRSHLQDDQCQFAYLRVISGDSESKRAKFVFISWCGESVSALKRAKMSVHKSDIKKVITNYGVEIHATSTDDLSEELLMAKIKKAQGADYSGNTSAQ